MAYDQGLAFLVHGNMACGVRGEDLIVRLAADAAESAQGEPGRPSRRPHSPTSAAPLKSRCARCTWRAGQAPVALTYRA